jgi:replicative DNA helicase
MEMRSSLRRIKRQYGLDLIIVDYLQLMNGLGENRTQEISGITRGLKSIAKDFNVPMLALSQLSRDVEKRSDKRPVMSDLRESGSIEQDADTIMFIYREEQYDPDTQDKGIAEVLIRKQRNGPTGEVRLAFLGEYTRFENLSW